MAFYWPFFLLNIPFIGYIGRFIGQLIIVGFLLAIGIYFNIFLTICLLS